MARLYYGNGECTIDGPEVRGVQIKYNSKGTKIKRTASDSFILMSSENIILIFPTGNGFLDNLFIYSGSLKIKDVMAINNSGEKIHCSIKRVMDYSELLYTKSEDITTVSELIKSDYFSTKGVKAAGADRFVENLYSQGDYFLANGDHYHGDYHVHLEDASAMTGSTHTINSQDLYSKKGDLHGNVIDELVPTRPTSSAPPMIKFRRDLAKRLRYKDESLEGK